MTLPIAGSGIVQHAALMHAGRPAATPSGGLLNVSIVTRVRNRKHNLLHTVPTYLALPVQEVILLDYDSSDGDIGEFVHYINDPRLKLKRIEHKALFDRSAAWNEGINFASAEWVFLIDVDVAVTTNPFLDSRFAEENYDVFYRIRSSWKTPHFFGCGILLKEHWEEVGGFNEDFKGWGWEDVDFYERLARKYREEVLPCDSFKPIEHGHAERTAAHDEKDLRVSVAKNAYMARRVKDIKLRVHRDGIVGGANGRFASTHYRQSVEYRNPEHMKAVLQSPEFASIVKTSGVFDTPTGVAKLFTQRDFLELERSLLPQKKRKNQRKTKKEKP